MKIVAISDTHNRHGQLSIPECDLLIHAGDATSMGHEHEVRKFAKWFDKQPAKHKIFVPGNHELNFERSLPASLLWFQEECPTGIMLIDQGIEIDGVKIWGSPRTPRFYDWAFNEDRGHVIRKYWNAIPDDTQILVTHGQPADINDVVFYSDGTPRERVGCFDLYQRIEKLENLEVYIGGHLHGSHGQMHINGVSYYNVCICDDTYYPSNPITIIDL
jgi:Icc-related predicted phosphoesterase